MAPSDLGTKGLDELIAYVVKHPIRIEALAIFNERPASTAEVAEQLGLSVGNISHHVKDLFDAGLIEVVRSEQRRGAREHYYFTSLRPGHVSEDKWNKLSDEARREISGLIFQAIIAEGLRALRTNSFDSRKDRHLSWWVLSLDEQGWLELVRQKARSLEETEAIQARSYRRMSESGQKGFSVISAMLAFERAS